MSRNQGIVRLNFRETGRIKRGADLAPAREPLENLRSEEQPLTDAHRQANIATDYRAKKRKILFFFFKTK